MGDPGSTGWEKYQLLVLENLKELKDGQDEMHRAVTTLKVEQAVMKAENSRDARWISGIGAAIGVGLSTGISILFKK